MAATEPLGAAAMDGREAAAMGVLAPAGVRSERRILGQEEQRLLLPLHLQPTRGRGVGAAAGCGAKAAASGGGGERRQGRGVRACSTMRERGAWSRTRTAHA